MAAAMPQNPPLDHSVISMTQVFAALSRVARHQRCGAPKGTRTSDTEVVVFLFTRMIGDNSADLCGVGKGGSAPATRTPETRNMLPFTISAGASPKSISGPRTR